LTHVRARTWILALAALLSACSGDETPADARADAPAETTREAAAARARDGIYGDQLRALDKARDVEGQIADAAAARREQIDDQ
jgi:hypothetical protein